MPFKFPYSKRIRREEDFKKLLRKGKKIKNNFFLYFLRNDYKYHRFAISVNRKIDKAVQRNYIKRRMKELFRLNRQIIDNHYDVWIIMKNSFTKEDSPRIEHLYIQALKKISSQW